MCSFQRSLCTGQRVFCNIWKVIRTAEFGLSSSWVLICKITFVKPNGAGITCICFLCQYLDCILDMAVWNYLLNCLEDLFACIGVKPWQANKRYVSSNLFVTYRSKLNASLKCSCWFVLINTLQLTLRPLVFHGICQINVFAFRKATVKIIRASEFIRRPLHWWPPRNMWETWVAKLRLLFHQS